MKVVPFEELHNCDLIVDAVYEGSSDGKLAGEPISNLLPGGGNMGGFRIAGKGQDKQFVVLFTTGEDKDWPDHIDLNTGQFTYYGDNKTPGHELHDTPKGGNLVLRRAFELIHSSTNQRQLVPPFFVFNKSPTAKSSRAVQFKGLAVPGFPGMSATEDLVAVWKTTKGQRFQNYRSVFTILDVPVVPRAWLRELMKGEPSPVGDPQPWKQWVEKGHYKPLTSEPTTVIRSEKEQTPDTPLKQSILEVIWQHFHSEDKEEKKSNAFVFESFAARIFQMHDQRVIVDEITRGVLDAGRDAYGRYLLGLSDDPVYAEFSLEAKCYRPPLNGEKLNSVGVKEVSRLISRIRHRQFGVLVTTSVIARQAYQEVREDRHPVIFLCGKDISEILINNGYNESDLVRDLLVSEYPV
ncbi:MAG: restriction endonuclease [Candidatus Thiodiazotropha taylori]|nr:restriction endonuclease [Candidatus Thiodiazotropha taylori]